MNIRLASGLLALAVLASGNFAQAAAPAPGAAPGAAPAAAAAPAPPGVPVDLKTEDQRVGYSLGLQVGNNLKGIDVDMTALIAGLRDAYAGAKFQLTDAQIDASLKVLQQKMLLKTNPQLAAQAEANQKAGDAFMAENAKKDGVKTTASGLQYKVITSGKGKTPIATDVVSVNYRGTLIDGKEFDASKGTPISFPVNGVIHGWTEALQLMKEGDHWQLFIPANLAYGLNLNSPSSQVIGPNSVLVFDVELLTVKPGDIPPPK